MKTLESTATWAEGMAFDILQDGHQLTLDADADFGGKDRGAHPKGLLLTSLLGCTGMDVIAILQKMRVPVSGFEVHADGDLADEHPRRYTAIRLRYTFTGPEGLNTERIRRAVYLSENNYCGVMATLRAAVPISTEVWVNGTPFPAWEPPVRS